MTSIPIPFFVAFLVMLLLFSYRPRFKETATGKVFALVLSVNVVSLVLIGLRWSINLMVVMPLVATLAVTSSALLYLAFCSLGRQGKVLLLERDWPHLLPIAVVALSALFFWQWVDFFLIAAKCLYAALFIRLARNKNNSLQLVRLSWLSNTIKALWGAVVLLIVGIMLDIAIAIDFARYDGRHAESLVGFVSFGTLLVLGWIVVQAARGRSHEPTVQPQATDANDGSRASAKSNANLDRDVLSEPDAAVLVERLNTLLVDDRLYAETELNLQRLARKAGVPARIISRAINSQTGLNVSQWVNHARIEAACTLLENNNTTVNDAMTESGFLTKSNFNREFRRIKGCSPSEWRKTRSGD